MNVAIVILNWNGRKMMEKYLPSVLNYSCREAEVIVADNASTDDSVSWLRESYPHVRVIQLDQTMVLQKVITKLLDKLTVSIIFCLTVTLRLPIIGLPL